MSAGVTSGTLSSSNHALQLSWPESDSEVYPGGGNDGEFRLVGSLKFLTGPNEWYYNPASDQLYMWTSTGAAPSDIYAKVRNYGLDLNGLSYVNVDHINLFATSITTDANSSNDVIDATDGMYLSQFQEAEYDSTLPFAGIYDANYRFDSGILLHGTDNTLENSSLQYSTGNGVSIDGTGNLVFNNQIHDVGYGGTYTSGVDIQPGSNGSAITHNTIYDTGLNAINMNTNVYPNDGYQDMTIAYNNIYSFANIGNYQGGIYACCNDSLAGTLIEYNTIHNPVNIGQGIHMDNGTYGETIADNLIYGMNGNGQIDQGGNDINIGGAPARPSGSDLPYLQAYIYNNTLISGENETIFNYFAPASDDANEVVKNNILDGYTPTGQNFGYISGGTPDQTTNLVTEQSYNSTGTNPDFTNAAGGNYTLEAASPAVSDGTVAPPYTDGYTGAEPSEGAYQHGATDWTAGASANGFPSGYNQLVVDNDGLCTDVAGASTAAGAVIDQYTCHATPTNQEFQFNPVSDGYGELENENSGLDIAIEPGHSGLSAPMVQEAQNAATDSLWLPIPLTDGSWEFENLSSGLCLDVNGAKTDPTDYLDQWTCRSSGAGTNQGFAAAP
jgi:hypothetical protein